MRFVAIALAALILPLSSPGIAADENPWDECGTLLHSNPSQGLSQKPCHGQSVDPVAPGAPSAHYYFYVAAVKCAPEMKAECTYDRDGEHVAPWSPFLGTIYEESNKYPGLQRYDVVINEKPYKADRLVLL